MRCGYDGIGKRCERRRWRMKRAERVDRLDVCLPLASIDVLIRCAEHHGRQMTQALAPRKMSGTATGRLIGFLCRYKPSQRIENRICGCGGIGRLIGFRFQRASVQVRVLSSAPIRKGEAKASPFLIGMVRDSNPFKCDSPVDCR